MSTAMMSAPSWASLIAWLRPWLRAAPVMKATFPATRPAMVPPLPDRVAGVDGELEAGHVPGLVGGEEEHGVADVDRLDDLDRERVHEDLGELVGHRPGDADHAVLGGDIRREERQALDARGRARADDRAAAVGDQVRR